MFDKMAQRNISYTLIVFFLVLFTYTVSAQGVMDSVANTNNNSAVLQTNDDFKPEAKRLALDLMKEVGFSLEKAASVRDVLVDYNKEIRDIRKEYNDAKTDVSRETEDNAEVIGSDDRLDLEGILGHDVGVYYKDAAPDLMKNYKEADRDANSDIVSLLSDNEERAYESAKDKWWKEVKDAVFSPYQNKADTKYDKSDSNNK